VLSIVSGATRGLGLEIARELLLHFHKESKAQDLLLLGSTPETAYKACLELSELALAHSVNARVVGHGMDMANLDDLDSHITRMLTSADQPGGLLPRTGGPAAYSHVLLVHSAGQVGTLAPIWDQELQNIRRQIDLNVTSPAAITSRVLKEFMRQPSMQEIVVANISSISATQPYEAFGIYAAGKAARHMLTATLAREADMLWNNSSRNSSSSDEQGDKSRPHVRCISYSPGPIDTDMQAGARESLPDVPLKKAFQKALAENQLVDPADSARVLVELITGPRESLPNGAHTDYYSHVSLKGDRHPMDYGGSS